MKHILVVGDVMLDRYCNVYPSRVSQEAPVLIVKQIGFEDRLGGAGNVAANLRALGLEVTIQGVIGEDHFGKSIQDLVENKYTMNNALTSVPNRRTTVKKRVVSQGQQLIRLDIEDVNECFYDIISGDYDAIIISDYDKGAITEDIMQQIKRVAQGKPIIVNGKPEHIDLYKEIDTLIVNKYEYRLILNAIRDRQIPLAQGEDLCNLNSIKNLVVTMGENGIKLYSKEGKVIEDTGYNVKVRDITGAGDTVVAAYTYAIVNDFSIEDAVKFANKAGSIKVQKDKTDVVEREELYISEDTGRLTTEELIVKYQSERLDG